MSSNPIRPQTPISKSSTPSTPVAGTWRHPKLDEIARRQNASTFTDRNMKRVMFNLVGLVGMWYLTGSLWDALPGIFHKGKAFDVYGTWGFWAVQALFTANIFVAMWPLIRAKDDMSDIPLTPAQRKLLGLPPSNKPLASGESYVTPPRFTRTPTPMSGSPNNRPSSPQSGSPLNGRNSSGSPFSPSTSQYLQKAMGGVGTSGSRRHSYGSPSPLGQAGSRINLQQTPGSPSPAASKGSSVGLNNRWLFEKGRRNSGNAHLLA